MIEKREGDIRLIIIYTTVFLFSSFSFSQNLASKKYSRFIDSADIYVDEVPNVAKQFLDSIPKPVETSIEGYLANYYQLKGLISDKSRNQAKLYQDYRLAIKYAEIEEKYDIAGMASLELFTNTYFVSKDSSAFAYLDKAKKYYTKSNNVNGLAEVKLMPAYVAFVNKKQEESIEIILKNIEEFRAIKDDAYYHLFAVFMLTSNYMKLKDFDNAFKFRKEFESLKDNKTIYYSNYAGYKVGLTATMAHHHFDGNNLDSTFYYLKKNKALTSNMNYNNLEDYYSLYAEAYKKSGNNEYYKIYTDSLLQFKNTLLEKTMNAGLHLNETLAKKDTQLEDETNKKNLNRIFIGILIFVLIGLTIFITTRYKKIKQKINEFAKRKDEYSYMQSSHEKLKVKVRGLEDYIVEVKKEIKSISRLNDVSLQREQIKKLYKDLHLNSSTVLDKSKSHLELVNDLNIEFFNKINEEYPQLDESEIIICYYLQIGFKNKEVAVFLNKSLRAIENKRFRIGKKLKLSESNLSLLEFLDTVASNNKALS
ncbi:hypothetical protein [Lacinutrix mariniflava]|uniref:hypothetical protein n=1 Tax=Lacinutrix mariniflava TaxID=342955 RepID=UPI0006E16C9B|nr:hypothetical protein [Lacinutrix mariniflava]